MAALNPNAITKFVGDVFIRDAGTNQTLVDIGAVRGLMFSVDGTANRVLINSDNKGTVFSGFTPESAIEVELLESKNRDLIAKFFNATSTDIAGASTPVVGQILRTTAQAATWAIGEIIYIDGAQQNISAVTVKNNGVTITMASNYTITKDPTANRVGITNISAGAVTLNGNLTIDYTHTVVAAKEVSISNTFAADKEVYVKIQAVSEGKYFTIELDRARLETKYDLSFLDPTNGGDIKGATLKFVLQRAGTMKYHDEIL